MLIAEPTVLLTAEQCHLWAPMMLEKITKLRDQSVPIHPAAIAAARDVAAAARLFEAAQASPEFQPVDERACAPVNWVSVAEAAELLGCSPQNVTQRLGRKTLAGKQREDGTWLLDRASLKRKRSA